MSRIERFRGSLLGLAAGDALGTTLEFCSPGSFAKIDDMIGGGPFRLAPGEWTDDTSMALCLAESLIDTGRFDLTDPLERYVRWADHGHLSSNGTTFDIGDTVHRALGVFKRTRKPYSGPQDEYSAGNGSLMRLAPVRLYFCYSQEEAIEKSGESSRTTHGALPAIDACRFMAAVSKAGVKGKIRPVSAEFIDFCESYAGDWRGAFGSRCEMSRAVWRISS